MKILIDTNVVLDVLLKRQPYYTDAILISILLEKNIIEGYVSASAITDVYYIINKEFKDTAKSIGKIKDILKIIGIASINEFNIYEAIDSGWDDFEDALQYVVGKEIEVDYIVTRNTKDYEKSIIKIIEPNTLLDIIENDESL
jgi:predicted nucleic acid-binding protein